MPSSDQWGGAGQSGKYPVKVYNIDGVLIYQDELGGDNTNKIPKGGVIYQSSSVSSMLDAISNPITFYGGSWGTASVISQEGHSGDLYDYYWTSYSRGTDGRTNWDINESNWHNVYLDGYIPLRVKSIYDPCPYSYRIPSNGTWNQFAFNPGWTQFSYVGGASWNMNTLGTSWFAGLGSRYPMSTLFDHVGYYEWYYSSTTFSQFYGYGLSFNVKNLTFTNWSSARSYGFSVRCIEDCEDTKKGVARPPSIN